MTLATVSDVEASLGRPITDSAEIVQIQAWLARVENRLRARVPAFDTLVGSATYAATAKGVEVDVVIRRILNPEGKKSERIDDYSFGLTDTAAASDLWPTDAEWAELAPTWTSRAFTIRPGFSG